jgi:NarL family two-component system response regulator LiaR
MSGETPLRIVIADDHRLVREGIRAFLDTEADLQVVGEAATADEAVAVCAESRPDLALVDLVMPGSGISAVERISKLGLPIQIVVLTSFEDPKLLVQAVQAGALCCLLKDIDPHEMARALRRAAEGEATVHPRLARHLLAAVREDHAREPVEPLSPRERSVLELIAQGMSNAQIAKQLHIGEKTVKTHVSSMLAKLGLNDRTQAAVFAWRKGWVK